MAAFLAWVAVELAAPAARLAPPVFTATAPRAATAAIPAIMPPSPEPPPPPINELTTLFVEKTIPTASTGPTSLASILPIVTDKSPCNNCKFINPAAPATAAPILKPAPYKGINNIYDNNVIKYCIAGDRKSLSYASAITTGPRTRFMSKIDIAPIALMSMST